MRRTLFGLLLLALTTVAGGAGAQINIVPGAPPYILPPPGASSLGGVNAATAPTNQFMTGVSTGGAPLFAQPSASNLSNGVTGSDAVVLATAPAITTLTLTGGVSGTQSTQQTIFENGNNSVTFPVPAFYPSSAAGTNANLALDLIPRGSPGNFGNNGVAWMDVCNSDIIGNSSAAWVCAHVAPLSDGSVLFGTNSGNGGTSGIVKLGDVTAGTYAEFVNHSVYAYGSGSEEFLVLFRSDNVTANTAMSEIDFQGGNSASASKYFSRILAVPTNITSGSEAGILEFHALVAGTDTKIASIGSTGIISFSGYFNGVSGYQIAGTTVIDGSRNGSFANLTASGTLNVTGTFEIAGTQGPSKTCGATIVVVQGVVQSC
jgi:hypothetical protein